MSEQEANTIQVRANFDDGSTRETSMLIDRVDGLSDPLDGAVTISVAGTPKDPDAYASVAALLRLRVDDLLVGTVPESDLDDAIDHAARALLGIRDASATPAQRRKFDAFMAHGLHEQAIAALRTYLKAVGTALSQDALGECWGVTVPMNQTLIRVNVGIAEVFTARSDGTVVVYLQGDPPTGPSPFAGVVREGVTSSPPNYALQLQFADLTSTLGDPGVQAAAAARVDAAWRPLIQSNFHSPLTEQLLPL